MLPRSTTHGAASTRACSWSGRSRTCCSCCRSLLVVLLTGRSGDSSRSGWPSAAPPSSCSPGVLRWRTTRYRITDERVELRTGWLRRERRSVPARPHPHRRPHGLAAAPALRAERRAGRLGERGRVGSRPLGPGGPRRRQHGRGRTAAAGAARPRAPPPPRPSERPATEIARLDWAWLRFAPLTFSSLAGDRRRRSVRRSTCWSRPASTRATSASSTTRPGASRPHRSGSAIGLAGAALLAVAVVGSMALFAERWYGYRLTREPDGSLRVRHGLLTRGRCRCPTSGSAARR